MPTHFATVAELIKMNESELRQEIRSHQTELQKARMNIRLNKEKDTAQYRRNRRQLARMHTALTMVQGKAVAPVALKPVKKSATVSAPRKATRKKASK